MKKTLLTLSLLLLPVLESPAAFRAVPKLARGVGLPGAGLGAMKLTPAAAAPGLVNTLSLKTNPALSPRAVTVAVRLAPVVPAAMAPAFVPRQEDRRGRETVMAGIQNLNRELAGTARSERSVAPGAASRRFFDLSAKTGSAPEAVPGTASGVRRSPGLRAAQDRKDPAAEPDYREPAAPAPQVKPEEDPPPLDFRTAAAGFLTFLLLASIVVAEYGLIYYAITSGIQNMPPPEPWMDFPQNFPSDFPW